MVLLLNQNANLAHKESSPKLVEVLTPYVLGGIIGGVTGFCLALISSPAIAVFTTVTLGFLSFGIIDSIYYQYEKSSSEIDNITQNDLKSVFHSDAFKTYLIQIGAYLFNEAINSRKSTELYSINKATKELQPLNKIEKEVYGILISFGTSVLYIVGHNIIEKYENEKNTEVEILGES